MKTIFIETVSNGFIVRLHDSHREYVSEPLAVFNRMADLQTALPDLLNGKDCHLDIRGDRLPETVSGWPWPAPKPEGGDRTPEARGGTERCPSA